jgi:hypothetical protein
VRREDIIGVEPEYIGDGVYASFDGFNIWLQTERETGRIERIAIEPQVFHALERYRDRIMIPPAPTLPKVAGHDE